MPGAAHSARRPARRGDFLNLRISQTLPVAEVQFAQRGSASTVKPCGRATISAVSQARQRSLATMACSGSAAKRCCIRCACRRPRSFNGTSECPWKRPRAFQSVSPCGTSKRRITRSPLSEQTKTERCPRACALPDATKPGNPNEAASRTSIPLRNRASRKADASPTGTRKK